MKNKFFFTIVFVLIVIVGLFLSYQNFQLRKELHNCNQLLKHISNIDLGANHLSKIIHRYLLKDLKKSDVKWKLVIIYAPEDCPPCLEEISYWANFNDLKNDFGCWGLVNHPNQKLVAKFIKDMHWNFPTLIIEENVFGENFGYKKTPIKVLLNAKNQIYFIEGPVLNWLKDGKIRFLLEDLK